jgi:hypothetical protein
MFFVIHVPSQHFANRRHNIYINSESGHAVQQPHWQSHGYPVWFDHHHGAPNWCRLLEKSDLQLLSILLLKKIIISDAITRST